MNNPLSQIAPLLPQEIRGYLTEDTEEIRFRIHREVMLYQANKEIALPFMADRIQLDELLDKLTESSQSAYFDNLAEGYLTIRGGHRVGVCGTAVYREGKLCHLRDISSVNIRLAHAVPGCALPLGELLNQPQIPGLLIVSPPGCGKTTLLREVIRTVSDEREQLRICVIDERSELAATHLGAPQNDIGRRTDVLNGYTKQDGILRAIRSLSPQIIAVDEIGSAADEDSLLYAHHAGITVFATIHGNSTGDYKNNIRRLLRAGVFPYHICLSKQNPNSRIAGIYRESGDTYVEA